LDKVGLFISGEDRSKLTKLFPALPTAEKDADSHEGLKEIT